MPDRTTKGAPCYHRGRNANLEGTVAALCARAEGGRAHRRWGFGGVRGADVSRWWEYNCLEGNAFRRHLFGSDGRARSARRLGVVRLSSRLYGSHRTQSRALRDRALAEPVCGVHSGYAEYRWLAPEGRLARRDGASRQHLARPLHGLPFLPRQLFRHETP